MQMQLLSTAHHNRFLMHYAHSQLMAELQLHSFVLGILASCGLTPAVGAV